ncbi:hypothetical protein TKK_0016415 [Trichogramma kaykai]
MNRLVVLMHRSLRKGHFCDEQPSIKLRKLVSRILRKKSQRRDLIHRLATLHRMSEHSIPGFHAVFLREDIEMLLQHAIEDTLPSVRKPSSEKWKDDAVTFVEFIADSTEYRDEPELDKAGKPVLRRTTPIHRAAEALCGCDPSLIRALFKIYNRFDANYVDDKSGLTHFHVACAADCEDVVKKFLEHGQDPDLCAKSETRGTVDPPLHVALARGNARIAELLLRAGADPNLASPRGQIAPLHLVPTGHVLGLFLEICDELNKKVPIDAENERGATPLHCALMVGNAEMAEALLRRGADPNLDDIDGLTSLHYLATYSTGDLVAAKFFEVCDEMGLQVRIDAQDKEGCTPLHLALHYGKAKLAKFLLMKGADPNLADEEGLTPRQVIFNRENYWSRVVGYYDDDDDDDSIEIKLSMMLLEASTKIERPAEANARDAQGRTPLESAVATPKPNTVDALLDHGADPSKNPSEISVKADSDMPDCLSDALKVIRRLRAKGCESSMPKAEKLEFIGYESLPKELIDRAKWRSFSRFFKRETEKDVAV